MECEHESGRKNVSLYSFREIPIALRDHVWADANRDHVWAGNQSSVVRKLAIGGPRCAVEVGHPGADLPAHPLHNNPLSVWLAAKAGMQKF